MPDIALRFQEFAGDIGLDPTGVDLGLDEGLQTAVLVSLFSDRRALEDRGVELPAGERRGWWADGFGAIEDDEIGSKLWLLRREKITQAVVEQARAYAQEALVWMVEDRVAKSVEVFAEAQRPDRLALQVVITRPDRSVERYRFGDLWRGTEAVDAPPAIISGLLVSDVADAANRLHSYVNGPVYDVLRSPQ